MLLEDFNDEDDYREETGKAEALPQPAMQTRDGRPITFHDSDYSVTAYIDGREVGEAHLDNLNSGEYVIGLDGTRRLRDPDWKVQRIFVEPDMQRQGIATAIYDYAVRAGFRPLRRSRVQTPGGEGLWKARQVQHGGKMIYWTTPLGEE